ncbi:MAG: VOC family protein [Verrucomicrobia bacterium]|nr:VOC family protein [Verrucomicrobiota bacterium]
MLRFAQFIYYVSDVEKSLQFYEKAFGFKRKFVDPTGQYGELDTGETALAFAAQDLAKINLPKGFRPFNLSEAPAACAVTFLAKDIHKAFSKAIEAGAVEVAPIERKPWGQSVSYVRDPEGILIEISSEMEDCPH